MAAAVLGEQEIREEFARRLIRRFEQMRKTAACQCAADGDAHRSGYPVHHWRLAALMTRDLLDEWNGEGETDG
jgi:hypothetical protein